MTGVGGGGVRGRPAAGCGDGGECGLERAPSHGARDGEGTGTSRWGRLAAAAAAAAAATSAVGGCWRGGVEGAS